MPAASQPPELSDAGFSTVLMRVVEELKARLASQASPLVSDRTVGDELMVQVEGILVRVFSSLAAADAPGRPPGRGPVITATAGADIGRRRADQHIHPAESLAAANVLFDVSLTVITEVLPGRWEPAAVALSLHHAIMENVVPAATSYVNVLLGRLSGAHTEERLRISRDLHDRVAHGIAVAHQRLQLSGFADTERDNDGSADIRAALEALQLALHETQAIATELRYQVGSKQLHEALIDFVDDAADEVAPVIVSNTGSPRRLTTGVQEEAFIVVRELVHNARRHAQASSIRIDLTWTPTSVTVSVRDDGIGFVRTNVRPGALGLIGARERAEAIGAELVIVTTVGSGTVVTLDLPIVEESA
ncbi:signal transduction histidine kinase [Cryobacterium sp. MP_3.1]|uniref:sensor histidine kinase n=1 Tax=Cryobacterium sp. MP_3.1 TaxID=3071711 RepID=UPI002E094B78|nr:signal transduction histidine kinase [Cryobacterium sp. MP_3.1]